MLDGPENKTDFVVNGVVRSVSIKNAPLFQHGDDEFLSSETTDITYAQPWYDQGFAEVDFLNQIEFSTLKNGLEQSIKRIAIQEIGSDLEGFDLQNYHNFVKDDETHFKIVSRTRDLFPTDFNFPIDTLIPRLGEILGIALTDIDPRTQNRLHIIVRINRPGSNDYNPPHKDIYEGVDNFSYIAPLVNFWIPIAGANANSNLAIVPGSHKINENQILRTHDGGVMQGNQYRVRMIKSWAGQNSLTRSQAKYGQVLIFSSHLIHGLGINDNQDQTRVALEFRLFKKPTN